MNNLEKYQATMGFISCMEREKNEYLRKAEVLTSRITLLESFKKQMAGEFCDRCKGSGILREIIAQDESRLVDCDSCKGTGLRE